MTPRHNDPDPWDALGTAGPGTAVAAVDPPGQVPPTDPWDDLFGAPAYAPTPAAPQEPGMSVGQRIAAPFRAGWEGLKRGAVATVPELAGNVLEQFGAEGVGGRMEERAEGRGAALAAEWESPRFRDKPVSWLAENLGQALPTTLPSILGGVAGGMLGGPAGAVAGAAIPGYLMGVGDIRGELEDAGMEEGAKMDALVMGGGVPYAAADVIAPARLAKGLLKGGAEKGFGSLFRGALRTGVEEGVSEGAQSVVSQGAAAIGTGQEIDIGRIIEEGARGGAAGMFFGAGGQAAASRMPARETPAEVIASEPLPEALPPSLEESIQAERPASVETMPTPEALPPSPGAPEAVQGAIESLAEDVAGSAPSIEEAKQATPVEAAPPWAAESIVEETEEMAAPERRQQSVFPGDDRKVETEYTVVEADQVKASHTSGYAQRSAEEYPAEIQGRAYHGSRGRQAREHTEEMVSNFDTERALDRTVSVAEGPSVVTPSGVVVAGNGRIIAQQRLYEGKGGEQLKTALQERAGDFGIDPAQVAGMQSPVLVRSIVDPEVDVTNVDQLRELNASSDQPIGKTKDPLSEAATKAVQFREAQGALDHFAATAEPDATIRSYLGGKSGREFLGALVEDGVISKGERARFADSTTGVATEEGRQLVERMFYVAALGDPEVISRAPPTILNKLDTSLPAIIKADRIGGEWEIGPLVSESLDLLASARAGDMSLDDMVAQVDIERTPPSEHVVEMARFLEQRKGNVRDAFRTYADQAEAFTRGGASDDLFGYEAPDAQKSRQIFGKAALAPTGDPRTALRQMLGLAPQESEGMADAGDQSDAPGAVPSGVHPLAPTAQGSERLPSAGTFQEGEATEAPKSTKIVRDLQKVLHEQLQGVKLTEGRIPKRGIFARALAVVDPRAQVVKSVSLSDVPAIGHEYGHLMQKLLLGSSKEGGIDNAQLATLPGAVRGELQDLGKGISDESLTEGWAEFWRRYLDNPSALDAEGSNARAHIEELLEQHPAVKNAWIEAREQWELHRDASPQARVRSHISVGEGDARLMSVEDRWLRLRANTLDDFTALQHFMGEVEGRTGPVPAEENVADLARLTRSGYMGVADMMIGEKRRGGGFVGGVLKFGTAEKVEKSLTELLDPVEANVDDFRDYMVVRRARELHSRDLLTGIRNEDVEWTIQHLEEKHGDTFKQAFDDFQSYNDAMLRYMVDSGVLSEDTYAKIKKHNKEYVPFHRVMDGKAEGLGGGSGFGHVWSPMKRLKGSGRDIVDPLEATIKNTFAYAQIAGRQRVSTWLAATAEREGVGDLMEKVLTPMKPQEFTLWEIESQLKELVPGFDEIADTVPKDEILAVFRPGDYVGKPNMISVLKEGKREWFEVDEELYEALEGLNTEHMDMLSRGMAWFAKTFRAGITLNPAFMVANITRDVASASVTSQHGFTPLHFVHGFMEVLNKGEYYQEFMASGGGRSTLYGLDRDSVQRKLRQMVSGDSPILNFLKNPLDPLRAMTELTEQATRVGEFMLARKEGKGLVAAGRASQEVSTNFDRHGAKMAALRGMSAFWNPALQGMDKLVRDAKNNPVRVSAKMFAYVTVPSMILYALNRDDEDYWEQPDYIRDNNWLIPFRDDKGERIFLKAPKPHEIGIWGGSAMERVLSWIDGQPNGAEDLRSFLWRSASTGSRGLVPQPTFITALFENMTNYNMFMESTIVPRSEELVDPKAQGQERASNMAQGVAQVTGVSPYKVDHAIRSWTGGLGKMVLDASDAVIDKATGKPPKPTPTASDFPSLGTFIRRPGRGSHSVERMYRAREEMQSVNATRRLFEREQRHEELGQFLENPDNQKQLALLSPFNRAADTLAQIRSRMQRITRDPDMDPDRKREAISALEKDRVEIARSVLELIPSDEKD